MGGQEGGRTSLNLSLSFNFRSSPAAKKSVEIVCSFWDAGSFLSLVDAGEAGDDFLLPFPRLLGDLTVGTGVEGGLVSPLATTLVKLPIPIFSMSAQID